MRHTTKRTIQYEIVNTKPTRSLMRQLECLELLVLTILLWIAIWGAFDALIQRWDLEDYQLPICALLGAAVVAYVYANNGLSVCELMR